MKPEPKLRTFPWVRYKCGCSEGLWVSEDSRCRAHGEEVESFSLEISFYPSESGWEKVSSHA